MIDVAWELLGTSWCQFVGTATPPPSPPGARSIHRRKELLRLALAENTSNNEKVPASLGNSSEVVDSERGMPS